MGVCLRDGAGWCSGRDRVEDADGLAQRERRQRQAREPLRDRRHWADESVEWAKTLKRLKSMLLKRDD